MIPVGSLVLVVGCDEMGKGGAVIALPTRIGEVVCVPGSWDRDVCDILLGGYLVGVKEWRYLRPLTPPPTVGNIEFVQPKEMVR